MKYNQFCLKAIAISLIMILIEHAFTYENKANKYSLSIKEHSSLRYSNMKNFARNLADTKKLRISHSNLRFGNNFYQDAQSNNIFNNENNQNFNNKNNNINKDEVLIGSILRDAATGDLSFHRAYLENISFQNTKRVLARARYNKSLNKIGWSKLYVETFDNAAPEIISWAAGFLEGKLTAPQMLDFYNNLVGIHEKEAQYLTQVFKYYENVEKFIRNKTSKESLETIKDPKTLEYWISVAMTQAQSDGLLQGYNSIMKSNIMNFSQIYFLNADGEVPELLNVFKYKSSSTFNGSNFSFREKSAVKKKTDVFSKEYLKEYYGSDDPEVVWHKIMANSHCSAIIRLIKDENDKPKDIFVGHTTWDSYSEMHRIFKKYNFSYTMYGNEKKKSEVMFSSYPGTLTSTDDYYVINRKIVVLETTLEMLDKTIYERNMPNADTHVPNYIRISVANRLANSGKEWTEIFKQNNSGTYNSQWMIVDYAKFKDLFTNGSVKDSGFNAFNLNKNFNINHKGNNAGLNSNSILKESLFDSFNEINSNNNRNNIYNKPPKSSYDDLTTLNQNNFNYDFNFKQIGNEFFYNSNTQASEIFFLLEQVPGYIEIKDMTSHLLDKGFWGSYNRPYFEKIYKTSGYEEMMRRYGKTYSYYDNPRAILINHEIHKVKSIEDMKIFMQMNSSPFDGNHMNALSPRYDLVENSDVKRPSGGIDSKIVNSGLISAGTVLAISGPSKISGAAPFNWDDWPNEPHHGLPEVWNFGWNYFDDTFIKN